MPKLHYGFLDESGILEKKAKAGGYFIVAVIVVGNPAELKKVVKNARKKAEGKFKTHTVFHAHKENEGFVKLVLGELAKTKVEIVVGVWDKRRGETRINKNTLYINLLKQTVKTAMRFYPKLNLVLHKRYTNPSLTKQISTSLGKILTSGQYLFAEYRTETERKELELADAVAWSLFQKYNNKRNEFYDIIRVKIKKESRLTT